MEAMALAAAYIGAAIAVGLGSLGPSIGQGMIGSQACKSLGEFPESAGNIRLTMLIAMTLIEAAAVYALIIALLLVLRT